MTARSGPLHREVLPRWRPLGTTAASGELDIPGASTTPSEEDVVEFEEARAQWLDHPTPSFAGEVLGASIALGLEPHATDVAHMLLGASHGVHEAVLNLARSVVGLPPHEEEREFASGAAEATVDTLRPFIVRLKQAVSRDPRNAAAWADLARLYSTLGHRRKADHAISVSIATAPENRFILRAGARFYVHIDQPDRAHRLLVDAVSTPHDPWLVAAELAVAGIADRPPIYTKSGARLLASGTSSARHSAELRTALGTLELKAGKDKQARRLFVEALEDPTENALAQAEWASRRVSKFAVPAKVLARPNAFEARAQANITQEKWSDAVDEAWRWHNDEPFSAVPTIVGSYAAATGLGDFDTAVSMARAGLIANPQDTTLLNNLAYALLELHRLDEAEAVLDRIRADGGKELTNRVALSATRGLAAYLRGDVARGRRAYLDAARVARSNGQAEMEAMALVKLCLVELSMGLEPMDQSLSQALATARNTEGPGIRTWLRQLEAVLSGPDVRRREPSIDFSGRSATSKKSH